MHTLIAERIRSDELTETDVDVIHPDQSVPSSVIQECRTRDQRQLALRQMIRSFCDLPLVSDPLRDAEISAMSGKRSLRTIDRRAVVAGIVAAVVHPCPVMYVFHITEHLIDGQIPSVANGVRRSKRRIIAPESFQPPGISGHGTVLLQCIQMQPDTISAVAEHADITGIIRSD